LSEADELNTTRLFQRTFEDRGRKIIVDESLQSAKQMRGYEITHDYVLYSLYLSCLVSEPKRDRKRATEDQTDNEEQYVERDCPFLVYDRGTTKGWVNVPESGRVKLGQDQFRVSRPMAYPFMLDPKMLKELESQPLDYDPHAIFDSVRAFLKSRIDFSGTNTAQMYDMTDICALWAIGTHFHQCFNVYPYIKYEGPSGCGKTTANWTVASISFHPILTPDVSDAAFYRIREAIGGTIAMDERDFKKKTDQRIDDLLNSAFMKGGFVIRNAKDESGNIAPVLFYIFGPFSFSGVQDLPYMTETRTLMVPMKKTLLKEFSGTLPQPSDPEAEALRNILYLSRFQFGREVARIYDELNVHDFPLDTRGWDMARPLIAVAAVFGGPETVQALVSFVNAQVTQREGEAGDRGEIKVLLALSQIVKLRHEEEEAAGVEFGQELQLGLTAIKEEILELYPEEDKVYWTERRIGKSLRQLGFIDKRRSGSRGQFQYFIKVSAVADWLKRLRLTEPTELTEHTEHNPITEHSVHSVVQSPNSQTTLEPSLSRSDSSDIQFPSGNLPEDRPPTECLSSVKDPSSDPSPEQTEVTESTEQNCNHRKDSPHGGNPK
jgi:hypothetical protein